MGRRSEDFVCFFFFLFLISQTKLNSLIVWIFIFNTELKPFLRSYLANGNIRASPEILAKFSAYCIFNDIPYHPNYSEAGGESSANIIMKIFNSFFCANFSQSNKQHVKYTEKLVNKKRAQWHGKNISVINSNFYSSHNKLFIVCNKNNIHLFSSQNLKLEIIITTFFFFQSIRS